MISVAHLITSLSTGGAETMLFRLLSGMHRETFSSIVISLTDEGTLGPALRESGIKVFALGMRRGVPSPNAALRLVRILRRERPHVLQTWLYHSDLLGLLVARMGGVRRLAWNIRCAKTDARYERGLARIVLRLLARWSDRPAVVIANSQAGLEAHQRLGYHPRRWEVIHNGVDTAEFRPSARDREEVRRELGLSDSAVVIGLVARYDPLKDHRTFFEAAARLADGAAVHFVLVGAGIDENNRTLVELIQRLGLGEQVSLLGERSDIARLNASFDIATCSSSGEGFPNILIEAMACEVPCVTTDVGDARTVVADTGAVRRPGDAEDLADGWRCLIEMGPHKRADLGAQARRRVNDHFALKRTVSRYESLYRELAL